MALGGCGFQPVYQQNAPSRAFLGTIELDTPHNRDSYVMNRRIEEKFGAAVDPKFALSYSISKSSSRAAIGTDGQANRRITTGTVTYTLVRLSDKKVISTGKENAFVGSSTTGSTVATHAADRDAIERLIIQLADRIVDNLFLLSQEELT